MSDEEKIASVPDEEAKPLDGVFVIVERQPDGSINTRAIPQGSVDILQVQTILGLALNGWRQQIGV